MNLENYTLLQLHDGLRTGEVSAVSIHAQCVENYEAREAHLQAYKYWDPASAQDTAQSADHLLSRGVDTGLMMGLPVSVKDLYAVRGMPTFAGSALSLGAQWEIPGSLISGLENQLSVLTGKTHTVEFAFGGVGMNSHWGTPRNPWSAEHRVPGGSSSGAGVSLMQGSALLALGTDTGGSVRIPASFTGVTALKTTKGRWPTDGVAPLSSTLDTMGVLARSVADLAFGFQGIELGLNGFVPEIPYLPSGHGVRLGRFDEFFLKDADPDIVEGFEQALRKLEASGFVVSDTAFPGCVESYEIYSRGGLVACELNAFLQTNLPDHIEKLDPMVRLRFDSAQALSGVEYIKNLLSLQNASTQAEQAFIHQDVIVTPTMACAPPKVEDLHVIDAYGQANALILRNTCIGNLLGLSAITVPMGLDGNGLPMGLQLMAPAFAEEKLLAIALQVEACLGTPLQQLGQPSFLSSAAS